VGCGLPYHIRSARTGQGCGPGSRRLYRSPALGAAQVGPALLVMCLHMSPQSQSIQVKTHNGTAQRLQHCSVRFVASAPSPKDQARHLNSGRQHICVLERHCYASAVDNQPMPRYSFTQTPTVSTSSKGHVQNAFAAITAVWFLAALKDTPDRLQIALTITNLISRDHNEKRGPTCMASGLLARSVVTAACTGQPLIRGIAT
jgi:hypothetical protein